MKKSIYIVTFIFFTVYTTNFINAETLKNMDANTQPDLSNFLFLNQLSVLPAFNEHEIRAAIVYPPVALRSGIEGRVMLELFIDKYGVLRYFRILHEEPEERGFGEAAARAFIGIQGTPAFINDEPVASRVRYPIIFRIR